MLMASWFLDPSQKSSWWKTKILKYEGMEEFGRWEWCRSVLWVYKDRESEECRWKWIDGVLVRSYGKLLMISLK